MRFTKKRSTFLEIDLVLNVDVIKLLFLKLRLR